MKSRFVGTLAVALTSLGIFAGTAGASNNGFSGSASIGSEFHSGGLGTCVPAFYTPAGDVSRSATTTFYPFLVNYFTGVCTGQA